MQPYEHKVQYYETDQMQCVHHSNYIRWFEEARTYLLEEIGCGYAEMEQAGIMSPVLRVNAVYKTMTRFGETVNIKVSIGAYTGSKITFCYQILDKETNQLRCEGESLHCFINKGGRPVSLKKALPEMHAIVEHTACKKIDCCGGKDKPY